MFFWCVGVWVKVHLMGTIRSEHTEQFYESDFKYLIIQNKCPDVLAKGNF